MQGGLRSSLPFLARGLRRRVKRIQILNVAKTVEQNTISADCIEVIASFDPHKHELADVSDDANGRLVLLRVSVSWCWPEEQERASGSLLLLRRDRLDLGSLVQRTRQDLTFTSSRLVFVIHDLPIIILELVVVDLLELSLREEAYCMELIAILGGIIVLLAQLRILNAHTQLAFAGEGKDGEVPLIEAQLLDLSVVGVDYELVLLNMAGPDAWWLPDQAQNPLMTLNAFVFLRKQIWSIKLLEIYILLPSELILILTKAKFKLFLQVFRFHSLYLFCCGAVNFKVIMAYVVNAAWTFVFTVLVGVGSLKVHLLALLFVQAVVELIDEGILLEVPELDHALAFEVGVCCDEVLAAQAP